MPTPRKFSLELDHGNPNGAKTCQDRNGNIKAPEPVDINKCEIIGALYRGAFDSITGESVPIDAEDSIRTVKCVVVTIGGTAYKICT